MIMKTRENAKMKIIELQPQKGDHIVLTFNYRDMLEMYMYKIFWNIEDRSSYLKFDKIKLKEFIDVLKSDDDVIYKFAFGNRYEGNFYIRREKDSDITTLYIDEYYCRYEKDWPSAKLSKYESQKLCKLLESAYNKMI